jgi:hypothetical protein
VFKNVIVRKTQDADSFLGQNCGAAAIIVLGFGVIVLTAIGFDPEAGGQAAEVEDVTCHGDLPAEAVARQAAAAQERPKLFLGFRWLAAHLARECE